jgi:excisionase family DNA binding protein
MAKNIYLRLMEDIRDKLDESTRRHKQILNVDDLAAYTGLSRSYIYRLCSKREIPHYKIKGRSVFFKRSEIDKFLLSNPVATLDQLKQQYTGKITK